MDVDAPEAIGLARQIAAEMLSFGRSNRRGWFIRRRLIRHTVTPVEDPSGDAISVAHIDLAVQDDLPVDNGEVRRYKVIVLELKGGV